MTPFLLLTAGCQYSGQTQVVTPVAAMPGPVPLALSPCTDRSGTRERDVAADATGALAKALGADPTFAIATDGRFRLTCEVTGYAAGSALQRWILPGWGESMGKIAATLTDTSSGATVAMITGEARVGFGGLYTIGAETYIVDAAAQDVAQQLRTWARGLPATPPAPAPAPRA